MKIDEHKLVKTGNGFIVDMSDLGLRAGSALPQSLEVVSYPQLITFQFNEVDRSPDGDAAGYKYLERGGKRVLILAND